MKRVLIIVVVVIMAIATALCLVGCDETTGGTKEDTKSTLQTGSTLASNQPTPTDIDYSLERYNLIRRAYWVNGQREKALSVPCAVTKPLGYIVLITESGAVLGNFVVDGKVSSLNSYLTPDSEYYEKIASGDSNSGLYVTNNKWLPDVDGSYGSNDNGIFFFTPDGKYIEWTGTYLYSDIPFTIDDPILKTE